MGDAFVLIAKLVTVRESAYHLVTPVASVSDVTMTVSMFGIVIYVYAVAMPDDTISSINLILHDSLIASVHTALQIA